MKKVILFSFVMFLIASCASVTQLPVSDITPAASIKAKLKQDNNNNYIVTVSTTNLASPERLSPPKKAYVVWINTKNNEVKNLGQLVNKNAKNSSLQTLTVFEPEEIFITAEEEGNVSYPSGIEISRANLN